MAINYAKPIKICSQYVQDSGNSEMHYVLGIVEMYEAPGLSINPEYIYDTDTNTINYTYTYSQENPAEGAKKGSFLLAVCALDSANVSPGTVINICVTNSKDAKDKKIGSVVTTTPVILTSLPTNNLDGSPAPVIDVPRCVVLKHDIGSGSDKEKFYFLFVLVLTNENNQELLQLTYEDKTLATGYIALPASSQKGDPSPSSAMAYISVENNQFDTLSLGENTIAIDFSSPTVYKGTGSAT